MVLQLCYTTTEDRQHHERIPDFLEHAMTLVIGYIIIHNHSHYSVYVVQLKDHESEMLCLNVVMSLYIQI